ncbi:MAG: SEC14 family lipid-binding protein [archaeon]|nr:SEC14 family lipid-binding protein [archaeon]
MEPKVQGEQKEGYIQYPPVKTHVAEIKPTSTDKNASGFYDQLNQTQFEALQQFKKDIEKENLGISFDFYDDLYLLRFLRARKFDLNKTMIMFKKFLDWRAKEQVDDIRENFGFEEIFEVKKFYPHSYHKTDKSGRPIYIELLSKVNVDELFKVTTEQNMIKYYVREYERLMLRRFPACSAVMGKPVEQSLTILDMNGIGISILVGKIKSFVKLASDIGQDYYPEMLGTMLLLNTNFFFNAVWAIVKVFIDEKTRKKITFCGSGYQKYILEYADAANVPDIIGGTCKCEQIDGGCLYSDIGPWNPKGGIKVGDKNTLKE